MSELFAKFCLLVEIFASKVAAVMEPHADSAIMHVNGGNTVNVFLGIGVAWLIAAIYHTAIGSTFTVEPGSLTFSVKFILILTFSFLNLRVGFKKATYCKLFPRTFKRSYPIKTILIHFSTKCLDTELK